MRRIIAVSIIATGLFLAAHSAFAHHSAAMFDPEKVKELTGTIKEFQWKNPHVWIQVYVQNASGAKEEWSIEGGSPNSLSRSGWMKTTFKPGDVLTVYIFQSKTGTPVGRINKIELGNGTVIRDTQTGGDSGERADDAVR